MKRVSRVVNIVDSIDPVNLGIWHAAISTSPYLERMGIASELWAPRISSLPAVPDSVKLIVLDSTRTASVDEMIKSRDLNKGSDIIVTHGSWQFPTRWARKLSERGFKWVYTPQGMLEPWAMQQKRLKKSLYFTAIEKPAVRRASAIRSVSTPEDINLKRLFNGSKIIQIPNGIDLESTAGRERKGGQFIFMSRLHEKKGVVELVKGWMASTAGKNADCRLIIAGPDQGELEKISPYIGEKSNVEYVGPIYGDRKNELLESSVFYILPSYSEGFPTALLEAMNKGLVPLISKGCNLPEAFDAGVAFQAEPDVAMMSSAIDSVLKLKASEVTRLSEESRQFVVGRYSLSMVAESQVNAYNSLLNE